MIDHGAGTAKEPDVTDGPNGNELDVYGSLYALLQSGTFAPGDRLKESELARRFGTSRTPVREAFRRLEAQGLLVHEPHKGMVVPRLDDQAVTELYVMREVLEGTAASLAARHTTEVEVLALKDMIASDRACLSDPERLARTNRLFHEAIYRAAHNRFLVKSLNALREAMALLGPTTLTLPGRAEEALAEHAGIVEAIEARDADAADEAARDHIRAAHRARLKLMFETEAAE